MFFFWLGRVLFGRFPLCSLACALVGSMSAFFVGMMRLQSPSLIYTNQQLFIFGLVLGFLGWIVILTFLGFWLRYGVRQIAAPSFVSSMITAVITVFVIAKLRPTGWATVLGLVLGLLIGAILCKLCKYPASRNLKRDSMVQDGQQKANL